jgi:hypothetical protein
LYCNDEAACTESTCGRRRRQKTQGGLGNRPKAAARFGATLKHIHTNNGRDVVMNRIGCWLALAGLGLPIAAGAEIFTCVDGAGRRLTADRPIFECADRAQMQLNPSGTVRRVVAPAVTVAEEVAVNLHATQAELRSQAEAQRQMDRALLRRYPSTEEFAAQRAAALAGRPPEQQAQLEAKFGRELERLKVLWGEAGPRTR